MRKKQARTRALSRDIPHPRLYTGADELVDYYQRIEIRTMSPEESQTSAQQLAQACAAALWENDKATQFLDMTLSEVAPGSCHMSMIIKDHMCNGHGDCHGGYIFTLADSAFAFACNTYNQRAVAQHCNITYIKPVSSGDTLTAIATEVSRQGRSGIYDIRVVNQTHNTVAQFRGHSRTIKGTLIPE